MQVSDLHFSIDEIIVYLEEPDATEFRQFREHLIHCNRCLKLTRDLSQLESTIKDNRFNTNAIDTLNQFKHHSKELLIDIRQSFQASLAWSTLFKKFHYLVIKTPRYFHKYLLASALPSLIIISTATVFLILTNPVEKPVSTYQNTPYMTFIREKTPGIGFFTANNINKVPYEIATVTWNNKLLTMSWEKVKYTTHYEIIIETDRSNNKTIIAQLSTATNYIEIKNIELSSRVNYQYRISGKTEKGLSFETTGGFIF